MGAFAEPNAARPTGVTHTRGELANAVTWGRVALAPAIVGMAALGDGRLAFLGLVLAGVTDVLDGRLARGVSAATRFGARLDSVADFLVLVATAMALELLHSEIVFHNTVLLGATALLYAGSLGAPPRASTKLAGGFLYGFALFTLVTGVYVPLLLWIAALALAASSLDGIVRASTTRLLKPIKSTALSHAPQASKEVGNKTNATASAANSPMPSTSRTRP